MFIAPFLFFYVFLLFIVLAFFFALIEIGIISHVFQALGLPPELAFLALLASLLGSYINIPLTRIKSGGTHDAPIVSSYGVRYRVPTQYAGDSTVVAINFGGAIVPIAICFYVLSRWTAVLIPCLLGIAIVALIVNRFARPIPGMGIATPMIVPPIVAAMVGYFLGTSTHHADVVAYVSGVMGTLIGADLMNLGKISSLRAPVASIGGAGTFDGIFLTGIVAVLLA
ncbi:MAG TPA: DUF1614 domain-containing protein [Candidatus Binataceae bacterium]